MTMRVRVLDAESFDELNVRWTDELAEDYRLSDAEAETMDDELRHVGRYWLTKTANGNPTVYLSAKVV